MHTTSYRSTKPCTAAPRWSWPQVVIPTIAIAPTVAPSTLQMVVNWLTHVAPMQLTGNYSSPCAGASNSGDRYRRICPYISLCIATRTEGEYLRRAPRATFTSCSRNGLGSSPS